MSHIGEDQKTDQSLSGRPTLGLSGRIRLVDAWIDDLHFRGLDTIKANEVPAGCFGIGNHQSSLVDGVMKTGQRPKPPAEGKIAGPGLVDAQIRYHGRRAEQLHGSV